MAGNSFIWRDNASRSAASDKIEFNNFPSGNAYINNVQAEIVSAFGENPIPKGTGSADSAQMDELQDTGPQKFEVVVGGFITNPQGSQASGNKLKTWMLDDKFKTGTFPFGRFGLELQDNPIYNLNPGTTRGYMMVRCVFLREGETKGKLGFVATLRFNGNKGSNSNSYSWQ